MALCLTWGMYGFNGGGVVSPVVQSIVYVSLFVVTARSRRAKVLIVKTFQRWTINPLMRLLLGIGVNPLGLAILETTGRTSGKPRRVPVGNGRSGDDFWIIAEHGWRAGYVRNLQRDPHVRVRLRIGWRYRWVQGIATVLPDDDPLARQRRIITWHPLRAYNAVNVRVLGADLLTVHVKLALDKAGGRGRATETGPVRAQARGQVASTPATNLAACPSHPAKPLSTSSSRAPTCNRLRNWYAKPSSRTRTPGSSR